MNQENGVPAPNYTQTPNYIFELMPLMGEAELRITFAIIRKTFGWHKDRDMLSLTQLEKLTGLSRQGVIDGTEQGIKRGTIERTPHGQSFDYLIVVNEVDQLETSQASRPELVKPVDQKPAKLVKPVDTQKKGFKESKENGAKTAPLSDKAKTISHSQAVTKLPDSPATIEKKAMARDALKAWEEKTESERARAECISSPYLSKKAFIKRYAPMVGQIFFRADIGEDRGATGDIFEFHCDLEWLAERLTALSNGQGDEYRRPAKDGKMPNAYWVRNAIEKEWSVYRKEKADAEQRQAEQADYDRRVAAAFAGVSQGEQDRGRSHADSVHLLDRVGGPGGNADGDAAGCAGIPLDAGGIVQLRRDEVDMRPVPQPPMGTADGQVGVAGESRSVREMFRDYKQRRHLATVDAKVSQRERAAA